MLFEVVGKSGQIVDDVVFKGLLTTAMNVGSS